MGVLVALLLVGVGVPVAAAVALAACVLVAISVATVASGTTPPTTMVASDAGGVMEEAPAESCTPRQVRCASPLPMAWNWTIANVPLPDTVAAPLSAKA